MNDETRCRAERRPRKCPACGSTDVVPILYGMPTAALCDQAEAGQIVLGGCVLTADDPAWRCSVCGTDIYRISAKHRNRDARK